MSEAQALKEALQENLPEYHPGHQKSTWELEQEEYRKMLEED